MESAEHNAIEGADRVEAVSANVGIDKQHEDDKGDYAASNEANQVGCLLGKGGSVIKLMSAESGAQIRILPRDKLPLCALGFNELIVVSGRCVGSMNNLAKHGTLMPRKSDVVVSNN